MNTINQNAVDNTNDTSPVPVIFRRDAAGNKVAFIQSSLSLSEEGGTIAVWHPGKQRDVSTVPLSYYHATTKLSDDEETNLANTFASDYLPKFGISIRKRLGKDLSARDDHPSKAKGANTTTQPKARRATDTKPFDQNEYLAKISVAITAAVTAALEAVSKEYASK